MSIGGFLGPILAGLTGYAEQQKQAEQNRIRQQEAQMRQQLFQQYLKTQQDTEATDKAGLEYFRGGGLSLGQGGLAQPQPIGGDGGQGSLLELGAGGGFSMSTDSPTRTPGKGYGGRASGGAGMPWEQASQLIKQYESDGGQNIEQQVLGPEGGYNPSTGTVTGPSSASGPFQMIDPTWRSAAKAAGIDVSQYPRAITAPVELQEKAARGLYEREGFRPWAPYNKNLAAAIGRSGSTGPAQPAAGAGDEDGGGGGDAGDGATAPMAQTEVTPAEKKEAKQLEVKVAQLVDPMARGKMSLEGLIGAIDKAAPNASSHARMQAVEKYYKLFLAPQEQAQRQQDLERLRAADAEERQRRGFEHQDVIVDRRERERRAYEERAGRAKEERDNKRDVELFEDAEGNEHYLQKGKDVPKGWRKAGTGGAHGSKPENIAAYDADGKQVFSGAAAYKQGVGWIDPKTQAPIEGTRFERTGVGAAGGAGRSGQQSSRQLTSSREILSDLQNVVAMPTTSDRGMFGGRQQGPGLLDALKENMAETLTDEDSQLTNSALAGISRELGIVVSPVYGGKWTADQFAALTLKPGQTNLVKLYNIARMRQTVDNALETLENTDWVGKQQKEFAKQMRADMAQAVPWTPRDVIAFRSQGDDRITFRQFVEQEGIKGKAGGGAETKPAGAETQPPGGGRPGAVPGGTKYSVGQIIEHGGKKYRVTGGSPDDPDLEPVQ